MTEDAIEPLSRYVADLSFDAIPTQAIGTAKSILLDSFGVALTGSSAPGVDIVLKQVREWGGAPESTVLVFGDQVPAPWAALLNGMMLHARNFEDTHPEAIVHISGSMLPSALAIAEKEGDVDGKRLLTALIAGVEVACRIGKAIETAVAFTRTGTLAFLGAAATACNLLGLDAQTTRNAFGIAYAQAAGNLQPIRDGALVKVMQAGFGAKGGVMSALWARRGLTGSRLVLEGPYGYLNLYERGQYQRDKLLDGLGDSFEVTQLSIKPYPCALDTHAAIMAALDLRARYGLKPQAIDRVTVDMPMQTYIATGGPYDEIQEHPQTRVVESSSRVSYVVAVALARGRVNLDDFTQEAVADTKVGDLARRIEARLDESLPVKAFVPVTTRIYLKSGEVLEQTVDTLLGTPEKPMSREQRLEKFWHCAGRAALRFPREQLEELISLVEDLEHVPDVDQLISSLAGKKR